MSKRGRLNRARKFWLVVAVVVWIAAPVAAAGFLYYTTNDVTLVKEQQVWAVPRQADSEAREQVGLALHWSTPSGPVAPSWGGIVQSVSVGQGDHVVSGAVFAKVEGVERIAYTSPEPFARILERGSHGEDVRYLNQLLKLRNLRYTDGDRFTWETRAGLHDLATSIGAGNGVYTFDPTWIVYLPQEFVVKDLHILVGAPAPSAGTVLADATSELTSATIIDPAQARSMIHDGKAGAAEAAPVKEGLHVAIGGTKLTLADDRATVANTSLHDLQKKAAPETPAVLADALSEEEVSGWAVPSVAVYIDSRGGTCILVRRDSTTRGIPVSILKVQNTDTIITGEIRKSDRVGNDPRLNPVPCT